MDRGVAYTGERGALIAYQLTPPAAGAPDRDIVLMTGTVTLVDLLWLSPRPARFLERLSRLGRVITFDRRGSGASDPLPADTPPTWEVIADDLSIVLDAAGATRPVLFAADLAGPAAMIYAAANPERVDRLVLVNTCARLLAADDYPEGRTPEVSADVARGLVAPWGTPAYAGLWNPSATAEECEWFAIAQRAHQTPTEVGRVLRGLVQLDVRPALNAIQAPTLVLHARDNNVVPVAQGAYVAEHIPGARFRELSGADQGVFFASADDVIDATTEFLTGAPPAVDADRMLATVVFTDIVSSTERAAELGDRAWRALLERHDDICRKTVGSFGGRTWKSTGDGLMASFEAPGRAIRCCLELRRSLRECGLDIRAGVHAGEVEVRSSDLSGVSVHIAARVMGASTGGGVLVSRTVADLIAGSELPLEDAGEHTLKGVSGTWQLFAVAERPG